MGMHLTEEMEGEVALPVPECDTLPRDGRRKKVDSDVKDTTPPPEQPAVSETDESVDDTAGTASDEVSVAGLHDEVIALYTEKGGENFTEFAADTLCRDEEEVDSLEKFTVEMLEQLKRKIETEGI